MGLKKKARIWGFIFWLSVAGTGVTSMAYPQSPAPEKSDSTGTGAPAVKVKVKAPRAAVLRAIILPGWGQWYNEKKFKALLVFGTEIGFVSAAIWHNQRVVTRLDESQYTEQYRLQYKEFHINMRNQYVWYLAGAILYAMADAYVDAHLFDFDESPDLSIRITPASAQAGLAIHF
ncbi:DUF5683 domain-containing protein [candidate division KSB1 bacterium]|nr:DUF5683 domain-containing protein [candidate division KSB1 bacterium]